MRLNAYGLADEHDYYEKTIVVADGINSTIRITVLEYWDEYPVEDARVLLFPTLDDWIDSINYSEEVFTTELGKCVFEGLNEQRYYVDVYEDWHDNYLLADESVDWIETQVLESGYIHDFVAWVDYYGSDKKTILKRISKKQVTFDGTSNKKAADLRKNKENKFSKER